MGNEEAGGRRAARGKEVEDLSERCDGPVDLGVCVSDGVCGLRWWEAYRMVTGDWPGEKCRPAGRAFRGAVDGGGGKGRGRVERKDGRLGWILLDRVEM